MLDGWDAFHEEYELHDPAVVDAVVQVLPRDGSDAEVVTSIDQSPPGSQLRIRVGDGAAAAEVTSPQPAPDAEKHTAKSTDTPSTKRSTK